MLEYENKKGKHLLAANTLIAPNTLKAPWHTQAHEIR